MNLVMDRAFLYNLSYQEVTVPTAGDQVYFAGQWHDDGSGPTPPFRIRVLIDGQEFESWSDFVATGGQTYYPNTARTWTVTAGDHTIRWELDTGDAVGETSENDNYRVYSWTTPPTLDLVADASIIALVVGSNPVHVGDIVAFSLNGHCVGSGTTPAFQVQALLDGTPYYSTSRAETCPNPFSIPAPTPWTVTPGSHTIEWVLDSPGVVPESNDGNNRASSGFTAKPPETCNGVDDDGNGVIDDPGSCWAVVYRFQSTAGARCLGPNLSPPSTCFGYAREIEAFIVASNPVPGTYRARQCSKSTDHIVVEYGSADYSALAGAGYDCSLDLGYIYRAGQGPASGSTPWANTCNLYRFRYTVSGGSGAHLFTRGADNVSGMTCEPPVPGQVLTNFSCFSGTPSGC
ncbi:MAG: hypothetical protein HY699_06505 [Deltaproteobacteria bacterium]|nr:hypothetical protein [Deltaproteobacteria bacterium]